MAAQSKKLDRRDFPGKPNKNVRINEPTHPLIFACESGDLDMVRRYLGDGTDPNQVTDNRSETRFSITPLMTASSRGHLATVELLVGAGAKIEAGDVWMEGCDKCPNWGGATALMYALVGGPINGDQIKELKPSRASVATYLIGRGANPNVGIPFGDDVLGLAVRCRSAEIVHLLLEKGAKPDGVINFTPLWHAICIHRVDIAEMLVAQGADPHRLGVVGECYLHDALTDDGCYEMVNYLLGLGLSCDHANKDGTTPLWIAVQNPDERVFDLVLSHAVSLNPIQRGRYTPVDYAVMVNLPGRVDKLRSRGGKAFDELTEAERAAGAPKKPAVRNKKC